MNELYLCHHHHCNVKRLLEKANTGWKFLEVEKAKNF